MFFSETKSMKKGEKKMWWLIKYGNGRENEKWLKL